MLRTIPETRSEKPSAWIDLEMPSPDEIEQVEHQYGIKIPGLATLREIESTSRLRVDGETLYMSAPMIAGAGTERWESAPTGFILAPVILITIRYAKLEAFDAVRSEFGDAMGPSSASIFVRLLEEIVDQAADHLEHASEVISLASETVFFEEPAKRGPNRETKILRETIRKIGRVSDRASRVRYMFLSVGRMVSFVTDRCAPTMSSEINDRLAAIGHDIASLEEFETSLSGRVQLLQDAATGLISIEQNDVVKVLTVASVVGVPPVLVVGIYGMNFKNMPELSWHWGYPFALVLCAFSALIPYAWFKWRHWL